MVLQLKVMLYPITLALGVLGAVLEPIESLSSSGMRETVEDAARISRQLIAGNTVGTMATIYPAEHPSLPGEPYSMQEYYASCHTNGSLTLILLPISRHSQNILHSPTHAASLSVWTNPPRAARARVSLMGNVTVLDPSDPAGEAVRECYLKQHPDARWWVPGDDDGAHLAYWARFDPHTVYFVGGFGDSHYIGYVPKHLYQSAIPSHQTASLVVQD